MDGNAGVVVIEEWFLIVCFGWILCSRYQASRDDLAVFVKIKSVPAEFQNVARWYKHISDLTGPK